MSPKCKFCWGTGWLSLFFCSNVPLILLISPCKFQEFAKKDKIRPQKNKVHFGHNLAKISYMRVNVNVVHTDALEARL